jgi:hypothetical protein
MGVNNMDKKKLRKELIDNTIDMLIDDFYELDNYRKEILEEDVNYIIDIVIKNIELFENKGDE